MMVLLENEWLGGHSRPTCCKNYFELFVLSGSRHPKNWLRAFARRHSCSTSHLVEFPLLNSSRADFRFIGKSKMFQIATTSLITRVSLCQPDIAVFSILYLMPISDFLVPISINRFVLTSSFYREHHVLLPWQGLENNFRSSLSLLLEISSNVWNLGPPELK